LSSSSVRSPWTAFAMTSNNGAIFYASSRRQHPHPRHRLPAVRRLNTANVSAAMRSHAARALLPGDAAEQPDQLPRVHEELRKHAASALRPDRTRARCLSLLTARSGGHFCPDYNSYPQVFPRAVQKKVDPQLSLDRWPSRAGVAGDRGGATRDGDAARLHQLERQGAPPRVEARVAGPQAGHNISFDGRAGSVFWKGFRTACLAWG
jgi:hypothetical protein